MPFLSDDLLFILMVAVAVFLLTQSLMTPVFGENRRAKKRMKKRLKTMEQSFERQEVASLLRDKYLHTLAPWERKLESLPGMQALAERLSQADFTMPAYRFILLCLAMAFLAALGAWTFFGSLSTTIGAGAIAGILPVIKMNGDRAKRITAFEEQLPDALSIIVRALRAGHPFTGTLQLVSEEMEGPVAKEFGIVFVDINYGGDLRAALLALLGRVPSVTVMAMVTAILIQRESGGNLAEVLEKLTALVRGRFRFQRQIRIYSAQGRMSAWVLVLIPFILVLGLSVAAPDYLPMMVKDPTGRKLIAGAFMGLIVGILWIRKIIRIEV